MGLQPEIGNMRGGLVIVNADDWGRDRRTTDRILDCVERVAVSSVSAMVFMEDSERAAHIALRQGVDAGLHLNFTTTFSGPAVRVPLRMHQAKLSRFLRFSGLARAIFHPGLTASFDYVVKAQLDEFERVYGYPARRLDGHHHIHLCSNVLFQGLLPAGAIVRRNFSYATGEKGRLNRCYRRWQDRLLTRRYLTTDYFFSLPPMDAERLQKIVSLAVDSDVEIMTHPANDAEYRFLVDGEFVRFAGEIEIASRYSPRSSREPDGNTARIAYATARGRSAR